MRLTLSRIADLDTCTLGILSLENGVTFATLEPPWRNNAQHRSCIPPGAYPLKLARSPLVERITAGAFADAWHVEGIYARSSIIIHPGNFPTDTAGCILPGHHHGIINGQLAVLNSKAAFEAIMRTMSDKDTNMLTVEWQPRQRGYPFKT